MATQEVEIIPPEGRQSTYKDYSAEQKAEIILLIKATGNVMQVSRDTGIPRQTLYNWLDQADRYSHLITRKQGPLADKLENIAHLSADYLTDGRLEAASVRDLLGAIHITVPAMQLLRGQPTSIHEERSIDSRQVLILLQESIGQTEPKPIAEQSEAQDIVDSHG